MNGPTGVDWTPGVIALIAGLILGALFIRRVLAAAIPAPVGPPAAVRDLEGKRDALLYQLRELTALADTRTPDQLARERYALELEAARVLRDLDQHAVPALAKKTARKAEATEFASASPATASDAGFLAQSPALRGFLWSVLGVGVIGLLGYSVTRSAKTRGEGESVTGNTPMQERAQPAAAPPTDPEEIQIRAAIAKDPNDLEARLALARLDLQHQDMMGVWTETKYVLERSPGEPRALSYQSLVRLAMGQPDLALKMLKQAIATAPDQIDAYVHMTLVYLRMGKTKEAEATIAEASRRFPDRAQDLSSLLVEMKQHAADEPPVAGDAHASVAGPGDGPPPGPDAAGPAEAAPAAAGGRSLAGVIELAPGAPAVSGGLLFVTLRDVGATSGPPLAARRMPVTGFPVRFTIGQSDSMMGAELPEHVRLEARVDSDGDPTTRSPDDPVARIDDVKVGTGDLKLTLRKP